MKDVLSQSEIDSLVSALDTGEIESGEQELYIEAEQEVKKYDFRRPSKFSKEQIRTLQIIHDNFARSFGNYLSAYLRNVVQIKVVSVSQVSYGEFINSLPVPTLMAVLNLSPNLGTAVLESNLQFVFPMIDLLCGGTGQIPSNLRELTEIEQTVMQRVYYKVLDNLKYAWEDFYELEPTIDTLETNPQYNQALSSNETVALITFSTNIGDSQGFINMCYPFISLESAMPHLSAQHWFKNVSSKEQGEEKGHLTSRLKEVEVTLSAVLGEAVISVDEFVELQVGDVLPLGRKVDSQLDLYVGNKLKFKVQPGTLNKKNSVQITSWAEEAEDNHG